MSLFAELKRRKVFQVAGAYLVVAWVAVQAASILLPTFGAPLWALRVFVLVTFLGFPLALLLAWIFDFAPEGVRVDTHVGGGKFVYAAAALLALLAVGWYFRGQPSYRAGDVPAVTETSVAVLPFANLSGKADEEYFSDGMTEELLTVLAKIPKLNVAARTSVFEFKGKGGDAREIGRKLGVTHLVEGSIRRDGEQVRVTAQLIRVADGFQLWSEKYDRELRGVFALQDDIARQIGGQLQARLGVGELPPVRAAVDPAAYDDYLRGRVLFHRRQDPAEMLHRLEAATRRAPDFAAAWATLSLAHDVSYWYMTPADRAPFGDILDNMKRAADRAEALDPGSALTLNVLANLARGETRYVQAENLYERAMAADPTNSDVREDYTEFLESMGRYADAEREVRALLALDPVVTIFWFCLTTVGWGMERADLEAEGVRRMREIDPRFRWSVVSGLIGAVRRGDLEAANAAAEEATRFAPEVAATDVKMFRWATRAPGIDEAAVRALVVRSADYAVYAALRGDEAAFFEPFEAPHARSVRYKSMRYMSAAVARPYLASARGKRLLREYGFEAYWRERGWPPQCRPLGPDDFECGNVPTP